MKKRSYKITSNVFIWPGETVRGTVARPFVPFSSTTVRRKKPKGIQHRYGEQDKWHFVSVTKKIGEEIKKNFGSNSRGFGSLPVEVIIGKTKWTTSIFPEKTSGSYILPLKPKVRKTEGIWEGDVLKYSIKIKV